MTTLHLDTETYSEVDIKAGTHRYTDACELMLFAWAIDDDPFQVWDLTAGEPLPADLECGIHLADELVAHNVSFDRNVLRKKMPGFDWSIGRWHCTMAQAYQHGLPGGLDKLCEIYRLPIDVAKFKNSRDLINLFCKPRPKNFNLRRATQETHPEEWQRFKDYAAHDGAAMRVLRGKMPSWNLTAIERELWEMDQRSNDRGFAIDMDFVRAAVETLGSEKAELARRTQQLTQGEVESATQRDRLLKYLLEEFEIDLPDLKADTLERRLNDPEIPTALRELLAIRLQAGSASVAKYKRLLKCTSDDGRLRGTIQFCGAGRTGRDAGRMFQPQNLPRPLLKQSVIDYAIEAVKAGAADLLTDNVTDWLVNALRGVIVAAPGRQLVASDLANIEGRKGAWLAGEAWKLQAFRDYDTILGVDDNGKPLRKGPDLYRLAYARAFNVDPDTVETFERQIGKVMELMLQYEGGVGAFITGAETYTIDLNKLAQAALPQIPRDVYNEAVGFWFWCKEEHRSTYGLSFDQFCACDSLKRLWRRQHPKIVAIWKALKEGAIEALRNPGSVVPVGEHLSFEKRGTWLLMRLPSGRFLCYPGARVDEGGTISYLGVSPYSKKWHRLKTYGGKFFENACQASSRDVLFYSMPAVEAAGFDLNLKVHDEALTEADIDEAHTVEKLNSLLCAGFDWSRGLPLAADGFAGTRYRKKD